MPRKITKLELFTMRVDASFFNEIDAIRGDRTRSQAVRQIIGDIATKKASEAVMLRSGASLIETMNARASGTAEISKKLISSKEAAASKRVERETEERFERKFVRSKAERKEDREPPQTFTPKEGASRTADKYISRSGNLIK